MTIRSLRSNRSTVLGTVPVPAAIAVAAPYAPAGPIIAATSQTSAEIGLASMVFAVDQFNVGFAVGMRLRAAAVDDPSNFVEGVVTDFAEARGEVTIDVDLVGGSGTFDAWNINVAGQPGPKGDKGDTGAQGPQGPPYGAPLDSPLFIGTPRAPTPAQGDRSNLIANTEFVGRALDGFQPLNADLTALSGLTETGVIYFRNAETSWARVTVTGGLSFDNDGTLQVAGGGFAPSESPAFTGTPTAPTPAVEDDSEAIATTAFVNRALTPYAQLDSPILTGDPQAPAPANDNGSSIATTAFVRDAIAPLAPLASPAFSGAPTAPTPTGDDSSDQVATTAFVQTAIAMSGVGAGIGEAPTTGNRYARRSQGWENIDPLFDAKAPLDSPLFTGTPRAPTPAAGASDTSIATAEFVASGVGGAVTDLGQQVSDLRQAISDVRAANTRVLLQTVEAVEMSQPSLNLFMVGANDGYEDYEVRGYVYNASASSTQLGLRVAGDDGGFYQNSDSYFLAGMSAYQNAAGSTIQPYSNFGTAYLPLANIDVGRGVAVYLRLTRPRTTGNIWRWLNFETSSLIGSQMEFARGTVIMRTSMAPIGWLAFFLVNNGYFANSPGARIKLYGLR
jgi:hypothetical protein